MMEKFQGYSHTVRTYLYTPDTVLNKLCNANFAVNPTLNSSASKNINTTLLVSGVKTNTYADTDWKYQPSFVFGDTALFMFYAPSDIGSSATGFFHSELDRSEQAFYIAKSLKSNLETYRKSNLKYDPEAAIEKIEEISGIRRNRDASPHESTKYY